MKKRWGGDEGGRYGSPAVLLFFRLRKTHRTIGLALVPRANMASLGAADAVLDRQTAGIADAFLLFHHNPFLPVTTTVSPRSFFVIFRHPTFFSHAVISRGV